MSFTPTPNLSSPFCLVAVWKKRIGPKCHRCLHSRCREPSRGRSQAAACHSLFVLGTQRTSSLLQLVLETLLADLFQVYCWIGRHLSYSSAGIIAERCRKPWSISHPFMMRDLAAVILVLPFFRTFVYQGVNIWSKYLTVFARKPFYYKQQTTIF